MLIVLAGEEKKGEEHYPSAEVSVSSISRHPVTHFTFSVLSNRLCPL